MIRLLALMFTLLVAACNPKVDAPESGSNFTAAPVNQFTVSVENKYYLAGQTINIALTHPWSVTVAGGTPKLTLDIGGSMVDAPLTAGSGTNQLIFSYTVVMNDLDTNGIGINSTIDLSGATIKYTDNSTLIDANTTLTLPSLAGVKVDAITPTISSVAVPSSKTYYFNESLDFDVTFSESVVIVGSPRMSLDFAGTIVQAQYLSGSGGSLIKFRKVVANNESDLNGIALASPLLLNSGSIKDVAGNSANLAFLPPSASGVIVNGEAPVITSITKPNNGTYLLAQDLDFTVKFNKIVNVTGTPYIAINIGGNIVPLMYDSGSGSTDLLFKYTIQSGDQDSNGLDLAMTIALSGGTIKDNDNHNARLTFALVPLGAVFVQAIEPTITSVTPPSNNMYSTGQQLEFTANFSVDVIITGTPRIELTVGAQTAYANYLSGSGSNAIKFRYIVSTGHNDNNGIELNSPIDLNSGAIKSVHNVNAILTYTPPTTTGITINDYAPNILSFSAPANNTYVENNNLDFTVTWSENVTISGSPRLTLDIGGVTRYATYQAGLSSSTVSIFRYTVVNPDNDANGIGLTATLDLNGATIQDGDLNNANLTFTSPNLTGVLVESAPTTITSVTAPSNASYNEADQLNFLVNFSNTVNVTGTPRLTLNVGGVTYYALYNSGSGSAQLTFTYTVLAGHNDADGIGMSSPVDLNGGTIKNSANNDAILTFTAPNTSLILIDTTAPTITSVTAPASATYIANDNLVFTVNFSESVIITGSTAAIVLNIGGTTRSAVCAAATASSTTCTYQIQAGEVDLDGIGNSSPLLLNGATIADVAGNNLVLTFTPPTTTGVLVDAQIPTITSVTAPSNAIYGLAEDLDFTVNFSEAVTVTGTRLALTIGATTRYATYQSGSPGSAIVYRYTTQAGDDDADGIALASPVDLNGGSIVDSGANNATLTFTPPSLSNVKVDTSIPSVVSVSAPANGSYNAGDVFTFNVTFTESVTVTGSPYVALNIGGVSKQASCASGSNSVFACTYTIQSGDNDADGITVSSPLILNGATIVDQASNNSTLTFTPPTTTGVLVDTTIPTITSVTAPASATYIANDNLVFTVNFSESVIITGSTAAIVLNIGGTTRSAVCAAATASSTTCTYQIQAGEVDLDGIGNSSPLLLNGATIADGAGNNLVLTFTPPSTTGVLVDAQGPTITSVTGPSNGTYLATQNLDFTVNFSESVTVSGTRLVLDIGGVTRHAIYQSGSPGSAIVYRYSVQSPDNDANGIGITATLDLNSGSILDSAGNPSILNFIAPTLTGVVVDAKAPSIASFNLPADGWYTTSQVIQVGLVFDEVVTVSDNSSTLTLNIGGTNKNASYVSGSSSNTLIYEYVVSSGDVDLDGINIVSPLVLNSAAITDLNSNNATLTFSAPATAGIKVDSVAPTITSITAPANGTYASGSNLNFSVTFSKSVTISGSDARLVLNIGGTTRYANCAAGTSTSHTCSYTIQAGENDADGIELSAPLSVTTATIKDAAGLDATLTFTAPNTSGVIVGSAPLITSITPPSNATYVFNQSLNFTVNFDQTVLVTGFPKITVQIGSNTREATYVSGSNSNALLFTHTLTNQDLDNDGIVIISPVNLSGGTIKNATNINAVLTFTAPDMSSVLVDSRVAVAANSTITGTGPVVANGTAVSTITITLRDINNDPVSGITPTFSSTNTGSTNVQTACLATDVNGISTCTLKSTKAELKTLSIVTPVAKSDGTVQFNAGSAVAANTTITGSGPIVADGVAESTITVTLNDLYNNHVSGVTPTFSATNTGSTNVQGACSSSNTSGISTCTLKSTRAQVKTLSLLTPFAKTGGTVTFIAGAPDATTSLITGTTPVSADGLSTSFIEITLKDAYSNLVDGVTPMFIATDTDSGNIYGACSLTVGGVSACTLASTKAEIKTLSITSPIFKSGDDVEFSASLPTAPNSSISGTTNILADGTATSTITITLKDASNNPVEGIVPTFDATNTGSTNVYEECTESDANGISTCTMTSTKAEIKQLRITSPVTKPDASITFIAGAIAAAQSTITGTGPTVADGIAASTITVTLNDAFGNAVAGSTPTFSATNTNSTNVQVACSISNTSGISTCSLKSTKAELKTLSILTPVAKTGSSVDFIAGPPVALHSTITGTGPVSPNGISTSTISITLKDQYENLASGLIPTFSATNSGTDNIYGTCSASNSSGISTCSLASLTTEIKILQITSPVSKSGGTVEFIPGAPDPTNSEISGETNILANGTTVSNITIIIRDDVNAPIEGITPTFIASGTNNNYGACSATNASGESYCTLSSTKAETKALEVTSPFSKIGNDVTFIPGPPSLANSSISATSPTLAYGVDECTVTITLRDAFNNPIPDETPTISSTGIENTINGCAPTDSAGQSICTMTSTKAQEKVISMTAPLTLAATPVDFNPYGINLEVPIEMLGRGVSSSTAVRTFNHTRTSLNTNDYVADENQYFFEIIANNTNTTNGYVVSLVNSATTEITSSRITIPANTTAMRRYRVAWTPTAGANDYRVRLALTSTSNQLKVFSAKIIVKQTAATATNIYIPLAGSAINLTSNSTTTGANTEIASTFSTTPTNTTLVTGNTHSFYQWTRNDSAYDTYFKTTPFMLETVSSISNNSATVTVGLYNKTTNALVTGATTTVTASTALQYRTTNFAANAANFTNGNTFELRINTSSGTRTARLLKAGLWIKLKYLKSAEIIHRLSMARPAVTSSISVDEGRYLFTEANWTNPQVFFQASGSVATSSISLREDGTNESGTVSSVAVSNASITPSASHTMIRSNEIFLLDNNRYFINHTRSSGTVNMGAAFLVIRAQE